MFLVYLHPREKIRENGMLPDYCIFKTFFISFSHITQILLKLGNWDLSHIVGFFILYKMKKKFFSIFIFFIKIYPVFFIENG